MVKSDRAGRPSESTHASTRIAGFPAHALVEKSDLSFTSGNGKSRAPQDKLETVQFVVVGIKVPDLIPGDDDLISNIGSHR